METLPSRIGKFEILSLIGRGAMGTVYKARDPYIDRMVALKRISLSEFLPDDQKEEFKARFFVEARAAGGLKHPNIVTIHDVDEAGGVPFMAMEFLEGGSLSKLMKEQGALPMDEASAIVRQVALGLAYAHERGIVHRDIKPDNILLDRNGRVVITDFGAAHLNTSDLTRTGEVLGTPHYMSPEQILGDPVDGRSDLFSLGVVFYLLVTGRRPFKGDTVSSVCYHIIHSSPEPVPEDLHVPGRAVPMLQKLLAKDKSERYQTGLELVEALNDMTPDVPSPVEWTRTQSLESAPAVSVAPRAPSVQDDTAPAILPETGRSQPAEKAAKPHGKGLWIALAVGSGALLVALALVVTGILVVMGMRRAKGGHVPPPATQQQAARISPPAPPVSSTQPRILPGAETPVRPKPATSKTQGEKPPGPSPRPLSAPERPVPVSPTPSPQVLAATDVLAQEAGKVAAMSQRLRFGKAFAALDDLHRQLNLLKMSATPVDEPALRRASEAIAEADRQAQSALVAASKPILEQGNAILDQATAHVNTDEDSIIAAYADVSPAIRWKERLPDDVRLSVEEFMRRCREELNDDEWDRAQAAAQGRAFPGQN